MSYGILLIQVNQKKNDTKTIFIMVWWAIEKAHNKNKL
jgi:hypothetical protein